MAVLVDGNCKCGSLQVPLVYRLSRNRKLTLEAHCTVLYSTGHCLSYELGLQVDTVLVENMLELIITTISFEPEFKSQV